MKRDILRYLQSWASSPVRKPLLIRGARQVGKTFAVRQLGETFEQFISINFELDPAYKRCFETLHPQEIINNISALKGKPIIPGKTLLFFDEVQVCPMAIQALRYFKENMPELHVIAAGSLLEFALHREQISMPVGRIEYLYMYPCTFNEFLQSSGNETLLELLTQASFNSPISEAIHHHLLKLFKEYSMVGGMPEALQCYLDTKDLYQVQRVQNSILHTYRDDFGKYANIAQHKYLQTVYDQAPGMVGTQISYQKIDPTFRSRDLKTAITLLEQAGLVKRIYASTAAGLPLASTLQEKKFKLHFLDVGLVHRRMGLNLSTLFEDESTLLNAGGIAEQVVAQELLAYQDAFSPAELYFWSRDKKNAQAEVDYILNVEGKIVPIEVKAGGSRHLKSLLIFLKEKQGQRGIKISTLPLALEGEVINIPIYMLQALPRLFRFVTMWNLAGNFTKGS